MDIDEVEEGTEFLQCVIDSTGGHEQATYQNRGRRTDEESLGALSLNERIRFLLTAFEKGNQRGIDALLRACPERLYVGVDSLVARLEMHHLLAIQAVHELQTTYPEHQLW